eukprot:1324591-Amorphochlora_amoeboformis.AAC.2
MSEIIITKDALLPVVGRFMSHYYKVDAFSILAERARKARLDYPELSRCERVDHQKNGLVKFLSPEMESRLALLRAENCVRSVRRIASSEDGKRARDFEVHLAETMLKLRRQE